MDTKTTIKLVPKGDKWTDQELRALKLENNGQSIYESGASLRGKVNATLKPDGTTRISIWFRYRYKFQNQQKDLSLGTWPKVSLKEIRSLANQARVLLDKNIDPAIHKKLAKLDHKIEQTNKLAKLKKQHEEQLSAEKRMSVQRLFELWEKFDLTNRKDKGKEVRRMFEKDVLPYIGNMAVEDVKKGHVVAILDKILERGINRMPKLILSLIRQMFRFAQDRDLIDNDPTSSIRKAKIGGKDVVRDRYLSEAEIKALITQIPNAGLIKSSELALLILLSTCCRVGEICKAKWEDLDLNNGQWKIPAENSKNGKPHTIYLSNFAIKQFQLLKELSSSETWIYPNAKDNNHVCTKSITKQTSDRQLLKDRTPMSGRSKYSDRLILSGGKWTPHDLRRTGATTMGNLGVRPDVIELCLNHTENNKMKKTYQHQSLTAEQAHAWKILGERIELLSNDIINVVTLNTTKVA